MKADHDIVAQLKTEGVALVPGILPREEALAARPLLKNAIDEDLERMGGNPNYVDHWMVHNLMTRGEPFLSLLENRTLHAYLDEALSPTCILYAYTSSSMPPNGSNLSRRIHTDCPRIIPGYWTNVGVMVALDDFTPTNGATYFLPRSQWREEAPSEEEFEANAIRLFPKAGDAIFFNARTWHRGGVNETQSPRHCVTMNVCRSYMKQRFDYPRLIPEHLIARLGPVGRRFIGMDTRVPSSLEEYYLPVEQRLYKAGQG
jgi:ectoine hydroxylase-related dioxygenase (phytanoyl-CoA dioxygenase family)